MEIINKNLEKQRRRNIINEIFKTINYALANYENIDEYFKTLTKEEIVEFYKNMRPCFEYLVKYAKDNYIKPNTKQDSVSFIIYLGRKNILISLDKNNEYHIKYVDNKFNMKPILYEYFVENKKTYFSISVSESLNSIMSGIKSLQMRGLDNEEILKLINDNFNLQNERRLK